MHEIAVIQGSCCAPGAPVLPAVAATALADQFKALADPTRIAIVNRLAGVGEVCVCDLVDAFALGQPTISHHLKVLRDAGLVAAEKRGRWAYYRVEPAALAALAGALLPAAG
jgi:ArsR family transcriptional regulator